MSGGDPLARCGGCDTRWRSRVECHCPTCHRHLGGIDGFDMHRVDGECVDPAEIPRLAPTTKYREAGVVWVDSRASRSSHSSFIDGQTGPRATRADKRTGRRPAAPQAAKQP